MDRKFILIPALAGGIFLAQSAQQRAEALNAPTVTIGQTSNPMLTPVHWGERSGYGYGGGWGRHGYGGDWGRHGYRAVSGAVAVAADMAGWLGPARVWWRMGRSWWAWAWRQVGMSVQRDDLFISCDCLGPERSGPCLRQFIAPLAC